MLDILWNTKKTNNKELYCVYCHRNKINNKRYIGQTIHQDNPELRWGQNGKGYIGNAYFWHAIEKYGWDNFDHIIIQDNLTKEEADLLEDLNIITYNTINRNFGYNLKRGGAHGTFSEEVKQKMSADRKGSIPWNKGKTNVYSESTLKKMSMLRKGKHLSEDYKQKIRDSFTEQVRQKMSESHKGKPSSRKGVKHTEEAKQKMSNALKGKTPWNKGKKTDKIPWNKGIKYSEQTKQKISKSSKNRLWINNGCITKFVKQDELQQYLSDGWKKGRLITKNKETINKK